MEDIDEFQTNQVGLDFGHQTSKIDPGDNGKVKKNPKKIKKARDVGQRSSKGSFSKIRKK